MRFDEIAKMPTSLEREYVRDSPCAGWHESLLRSYHILAKVKWLLEKRTDTEVITELIALMESQ